MKVTKFLIEVTSDDLNVPEKILWKNSDAPEIEEAKAISIGVWDAKGRGSLIIDLWNKQMQTMELKAFCLDLMKKLGETVQNATDDHVIANIIDNACFQISSELEEQMRNEN